MQQSVIERLSLYSDQVMFRALGLMLCGHRLGSTRAKCTAERAATGWKKCNPTTMCPALPNIGIAEATAVEVNCISSVLRCCSSTGWP